MYSVGSGVNQFKYTNGCSPIDGCSPNNGGYSYSPEGSSKGVLTIDGKSYTIIRPKPMDPKLFYVEYKGYSLSGIAEPGDTKALVNEVLRLIKEFESDGCTSNYPLWGYGTNGGANGGDIETRPKAPKRSN